MISPPYFFKNPAFKNFSCSPRRVNAVHAERQQRLADVKPRKLFALEENHATSGAREQRRGRAAGRSAANDRDVVHAAAHDALMLPNFRNFGRDAALRRPIGTTRRPYHDSAS